MRFSALLFHGVANIDRYGYISPQKFREYISWLVDNGYTVDSCAGLLSRIGSGNIPNLYVVITFDDGHKSNLIAAHILNEYNLTATFFITTGTCGLGNYLDKGEIRELSNLGEIGSHSVNHKYLNRLSEPEVIKELKISQTFLEDIVGKDVISFSAPHGALNLCVINAAFYSGYQIIAGSKKWWNVPKMVKNKKIINRISIDHTMPRKDFHKIISNEKLFYYSKFGFDILAYLPKRILMTEKMRPLLRRLLLLQSRKNRSDE